jgi:hypothetical protein
MMNNAPKIVDANEFVRNIAFGSEAGRHNKVFCPGSTTIGSLDGPFTIIGVELSIYHHTVKGSLFLDAEDFVTMVKVCAQILVVGVVARPNPILVSLWDRELVLWDFRINARTRVAVPSPGPAEVLCTSVQGLSTLGWRTTYIASFIDDCIKSSLLQLIPAIDAAEPTPYNEGIDIQVVGVRSGITKTLSIFAEFSLDLHIGGRLCRMVTICKLVRQLEVCSWSF